MFRYSWRKVPIVHTGIGGVGAGGVGGSVAGVVLVEFVVGGEVQIQLVMAV